MSQEKAQLIAPEGTFTVPGLNVAGVVTGGNFVGNVTGTASSVAKGANLIVGVLTASSFVGDVTGNVTGITSNTDNLILGEVTATSMVGDFTGIASGITGGPNIVAGLVTATKFQGDTTGSSTGVSGGKNINVGTFTASSFAGDLTGNAAGLSTTTVNLKLGITSATSFAGDLTGNASELAGSSANLKLGITSASSFAGDLTGNAANLAGSSARLKLGIVTATSFAGNLTGNAANLTGTNANLNLGIVTASSFAGNLTGNVASLSTNNANMRLGIVTASSFAGNLLGNAGSIASNNKNLKFGICSASSFAGDLTGNASAVSGTPNLKLGICTASSFAGNLTGNAAGLSNNTSHANLGIVTATSFVGDGSNLTGISAGPVSQQAVTSASGTTTIDLDDGNVIYFNNTQATTVAFSNPGTTNVVYFINYENGGGDNITWPTSIAWTGGSQPTLASGSNDVSILKLITRNSGTTWYGSEVYDETEAYQLWGWGRDRGGSLGQGNATPSSGGNNYFEPVPISGGDIGGNKAVWRNIPGNDSATQSVHVKSDGTLWSWGYNDTGALGQNDGSASNGSLSSPTQIGTDSTWAYAEAGGTPLATKTDGTLWAWGYAHWGKMGTGLGGTNNRSSPVQIPGTTWARGHQKLSAGDNHAGCIKTDGTLWTWGRNKEGQLGQNDTIPTNTGLSSPKQVPGTTWKALYCLSYGSAAIKTDGTLWMWGRNTHGDLGQNNTDGYSSPRQIPGTTWDSGARFGGSGWGFMAIKTNGTLWAWGYNQVGTLGQNNVIRYSSPVQIPGTTWSKVSQNRYGGAAIKTDGTLWTWGENESSSPLGQGPNIPTSGISSPVQVGGGTNYVAVSGRRWAHRTA